MTTPAQIELLARALARDDECAWADRLAHCVQCREDAEEYRKEATAILAQLGPLDPLGAVAMREKAASKATGFLVGDPANGIPLRNPMSHEINTAIRAIPLPTHADRLAAALAMPEIARLVEAARKTWDEACSNHDKPPPIKYMAPYGGLAALYDALAALTPTTDGETKGDA